MADLISIRPAEARDVPGMTAIRAVEWETQQYWEDRIGAYLRSESFPQKALAARAAWVAENGEQIVGFVAGHLTQRFDCEGELEWINVTREYPRRGNCLAIQCLAGSCTRMRFVSVLTLRLRMQWREPSTQNTEQSSWSPTGWCGGMCGRCGSCDAVLPQIPAPIET